MRIEARIACSSHPRSHVPWVLSDKARAELVEQAPGLPVTLNYDPTQLLGRVIGASLTDDGGVEVVLDLPAGPKPPFSVGPAFIMDIHEVRSASRFIDHATFREVAILPPEGGGMDQEGRIYEGRPEDISEADSARLDGYLRGRAEEGEVAKLRRAHQAEGDARDAQKQRQEELRARKEAASRIRGSEGKVVDPEGK